MLKKVKKLVSLALVLALSFVVCVPTFAAELPACRSTSSSQHPDTPGGTLTQEEISKLKDSEIKPQAGSTQTYKYVDITESYDGERDRGVVMIGRNNRPNAHTDSCTFTKTFTVSNSANIAAGFSRRDVEATVGYSVTWSDTRSFSYTATLKKGESVNIHYKDLYHVQKLLFTTVTDMWEGNSITPIERRKYAHGWAEQWYAGELYAT